MQEIGMATRVLPEFTWSALTSTAKGIAQTARVEPLISAKAVENIKIIQKSLLHKDITPCNPLFTTEVFDPDALQLIQNSQYGNSACMFTQSLHYVESFSTLTDVTFFYHS